MSLQTWSETLVTQTADSTALASSSARTTIIHPAASYTLPTNYFSYVGKMLRIEASGRISTLTASPGTLTLDIGLGASTVVFTSGALALNTTAKTNVAWSFVADLVVRSVGNSTNATIIGIGEFKSEAVIGSPAASAGGSGVLLLPASAPAVGTGFDSTAAQALGLFGTWSVNNASNSITTHIYKVISLN